MDLQIFERFRALIYKESGIVLHPEKITLLDNRIQKRLRELRLKDPGEYFQIIETDASGDELINLIDSISTNFTYFYREPDHFQTLAKAQPDSDRSASFSRAQEIGADHRAKRWIWG